MAAAGEAWWVRRQVALAAGMVALAVADLAGATISCPPFDGPLGDYYLTSPDPHRAGCGPFPLTLLDGAQRPLITFGPVLEPAHPVQLEGRRAYFRDERAHLASADLWSKATATLVAEPVRSHAVSPRAQAVAYVTMTGEVRWRALPEGPVAVVKHGLGDDQLRPTRIVAWAKDQRSFWLCRPEETSVTFVRVEDGVAGEPRRIPGSSLECNTPFLAPQTFDPDRGRVLHYVRPQAPPVDWDLRQLWLTELATGRSAYLGDVAGQTYPGQGADGWMPWVGLYKNARKLPVLGRDGSCTFTTLTGSRKVKNVEKLLASGPRPRKT